MENKNGLIFRCSKCKGEIPEDAKKCKHCGTDLRNWFARHKGLTVLLVLIGFIMILSWSTGEKTPTISNSRSTVGSRVSTPAATPEPVPQAELLELLSLRCYSEYSFYRITGQVKNISEESIDRVTAVGTAYTKDGDFVKSGDALIEYDPVLPGQISPFEVIMNGNPEISKCDVGFKKLMGPSIKTKDSRK